MKNLTWHKIWALTCSVAFCLVALPAENISWDKPPAPRPKDPRLELQPNFDANGVVYDWIAYIKNPTTNDKQEIIIDENERVYRITDSANENIWTISLKLYSQVDRLAPMPQGVRVCLKDVKHPVNSEKPHFECDVSGQVTVALTLDCPETLKSVSLYDPKRIAGPNYTMRFAATNFDPKSIGSAKTIITPADCANCVYIENSAFTHPDRAGGPEVASHSDRTLFAHREIVNEIRIYQGPLDTSQGSPNGLAYAWQGSRTNPSLSVSICRHDPQGLYGVTFTIPRGFVYPNVDGTIKRVGGLTALLRGNQLDKNKNDDVDDDTGPPPVTP